MKLPNNLKILTFLMAIMGSFTLLMALLNLQFISADIIFFIFLIFLGSLFFWETTLHTRLYVIIWNIITIVFVIYLFYNFQARNLIVSAVYLSVFLMIYKCYNRKSNKDYLQIYIISFFQYVSCTGLTSGPFFFVSFVLYVFVAFCALSVFHMKRRLEEYSVARFFDKEGRKYLVAGGFMEPEDIKEVNVYRRQVLTGIVTGGFLSTIFMVAVLIIIFAVFLFFILPRPLESGAPSFLAILGQEIGDEKITGISDSMDLSEGGQIIEDDTLVMKIKPLNPRTGLDPVLWRAGAFDYFDGKNWRNKAVGSITWQIQSSNIFEPVAIRSGEAGSSYEQLIENPELTGYQIFVELPSIVKIFSANTPFIAITGIKGIISEEPNQTYSIRFSSRGYDKYSYLVFSKWKIPHEQELRLLTGYDRHFLRPRNSFLQLPESIPGIDDILNQIDIGKYENIYDKVKAIEKYLTSNLTYTMNIKRTPGIDSPVEDFLLHTKSGHCELFATALAVLCRRAGIACRVAYGYKTDEWNEYGQFYQVRQRDAHAWVEVFFPNVGEWVYFDPSPTTIMGNESLGFFKGIIRKFFLFIEALKSKWYDSVVFYDLTKQKEFAMRIIEKIIFIGLHIKKWIEATGSFAYSIWRWVSDNVVIGSIAIISLMSAIVAAMLLLRKKIITHNQFKRSYKKKIRFRHHQVRFYENMLKILMGVNIVKPHNITPMEFAENIMMSQSELHGVMPLTKYYYMVRFGGKELNSSEIIEIKNILQNLRKAVFLKR